MPDLPTILTRVPPGLVVSIYPHAASVLPEWPTIEDEYERLTFNALFFGGRCTATAWVVGGCTRGVVRCTTTGQARSVGSRYKDYTSPSPDQPVAVAYLHVSLPYRAGVSPVELHVARPDGTVGRYAYPSMVELKQPAADFNPDMEMISR